MAWINYTSGDEPAGTARIAAFVAAHPEAEVLVSDNDVERCVLDSKEGGYRTYVWAVEHQTVKEYRALTKETAMYLKEGLSSNDKCNLIVSHLTAILGQVMKVMCSNLVGVERQAAVSRSNEADGYILTVTESKTLMKNAQGEILTPDGDGNYNQTAILSKTTRGDVSFIYTNAIIEGG